MGLHFASADHHGVNVSWWAVVPGVMQRPNCFEVTPGRVKVRVSARPDANDYYQSLTDEQRRSLAMGWEMEVDVSRPT